MDDNPTKQDAVSPDDGLEALTAHLVKLVMAGMAGDDIEFEAARNQFRRKAKQLRVNRPSAIDTSDLRISEADAERWHKELLETDAHYRRRFEELEAYDD